MRNKETDSIRQQERLKRKRAIQLEKAKQKEEIYMHTKVEVGKEENRSLEYKYTGIEEEDKDMLLRM